ncbi:MAG: YncE family protein [Terracidiphilus sp.]|jgi:YVTN family beta-propeller protein
MSDRRNLRILNSVFVATALLGGLLASPALLTAQKPYHIVDRWKLGGEGGWDYLLADPPAHRLYITHGVRVEVVDSLTGKPVGAITGLQGTHGVALDDTGKLGYISDGKGNAVVVFDRATLATVATIPAGQNPDAIVFEPVTQTVWAFNGRSQDASVIDVATRKVVATIPLPGKPEFAAVDGKGMIYDNIEDKSELIRIDGKAKKLTGEWKLAGCDGPSGLAIDVAGGRLFSVCGGKKMAVTDAKTGQSIGVSLIGVGPDAAGWDAMHKLAFASCGEGVLSVIDAGAPGYPSVESLPTQSGARTMAYDSQADRIYLVTADFGPRPEPTAAMPHARPPVIPGSFVVLVIGR